NIFFFFLDSKLTHHAENQALRFRIIAPCHATAYMAAKNWSFAGTKLLVLQRSNGSGHNGKY
ncbi:MAG: hypothetical protein P8J55_12695, partial [Pseudomonadales bacterium]|nr:hypothetical protein [Pseudomonadales bacterium]